MRVVPVVLVLCAVWAAAPCSCAPPAAVQPEAETRSAFAPLDDVRLLANGLLQLGQSLREFVQRTKGQINDIFQKLNIFDRSFDQLTVLAGEIKVEGEELKKTTVVLQANNEEMKGMSAQINSKVDDIMQERSRLQDKVEGLERKLSSLSQGRVSAEQEAQLNSLRTVIFSQERSIMELLKAVSEQSNQIDHQRAKIKNLEDKLTMDTLAQETVETMSELFDIEAPTLPPSPSSVGDAQTMDLASDCSEMFTRGERASGVYIIRPNGSEPFRAFCDMSDAHGATVIQRRMDGFVNFDQTWEKYECGFGLFQGEFWLGLRHIHALSAQGPSILHIQLEDWKQNHHDIKYRFHLQGPESNYTIHLRHLSGDLPDPMGNHTGMMFSTKDRDNDNHRDVNCAHSLTGGWWFNACGDANLNGRYFHLRPKGRGERRQGIQWRSGRRAPVPLRLTQISVYPSAPSQPSPASSSSSSSGILL